MTSVSTSAGPHYEPFGWEQWPEHPMMSYQFRRALGETQEGGGAISECFQAASRMSPGDEESWHTEWLRVADRNRERAIAAERAGHVNTARNAYLRATDQYRSSEFWLEPNDPRRLATFSKCEESFQAAGKYFRPALEPVEIPYENGHVLPAYFLRPEHSSGKVPVIISFGGLDSFKEELYFMVARGALERGIACLLVDGPGQGATLRRQRIVSRFDYEVPVGKCIDYLLTRDDVDGKRLAVSGSSMGGYYAARAGCFEQRLAAVIAHGAVWSVAQIWASRGEDHPLARHIKWVLGVNSVAEAVTVARHFTLEGCLQGMRAPFLILHGGHDTLGVQRAHLVHDAAKSAGVDVTFDLVGAEETGAEHCQHDNPTLGEERMMDWLAERFHMDERSLRA